MRIDPARQELEQGASPGLEPGRFVARRFAELQGGRISVRDTTDSGATVNVALAVAGPNGVDG